MVAGSEVLGALAVSAASSSDFQKRVYRLCKQIPRGKVSTYGEIARALGRPKAYRAVGNALRHNPFAPHVPCHRVLSSDLKLNGFNGSRSCSELQRKRALLIEEGVVFKTNKVNLSSSTTKVSIKEGSVGRGEKSAAPTATRTNSRSPKRGSKANTNTSTTSTSTSAANKPTAKEAASSKATDAIKEEPAESSVNELVVDPTCVFTFS